MYSNNYYFIWKLKLIWKKLYVYKISSFACEWEIICCFKGDLWSDSPEIFSLRLFFLNFLIFIIKLLFILSSIKPSRMWYFLLINGLQKILFIQLQIGLQTGPKRQLISQPLIQKFMNILRTKNSMIFIKFINFHTRHIMLINSILFCKWLCFKTFMKIICCFEVICVFEYC